MQTVTPANVDTVIVDGRILKRSGRLIAYDMPRIIDQAEKSASGICKRACELLILREHCKLCCLLVSMMQLRPSEQTGNPNYGSRLLSYEARSWTCRGRADAWYRRWCGHDGGPRGGGRFGECRCGDSCQRHGPRSVCFFVERVHGSSARDPSLALSAWAGSPVCCHAPRDAMCSPARNRIPGREPRSGRWTRLAIAWCWAQTSAELLVEPLSALL